MMGSSREGIRGVIAAFALAAACDSVPRQAVTSCEQTVVLPGVAKTDILFVVDDSGSMAASQANLASNFQAFIDRLSSSAVKNDFQIGITTSSVDTYDPASRSYPNTFWNPTTPGNAVCPAPPYPDPGTPYPAGALVSVSGGAAAESRTQSTVAPPRLLPAGSPTLVADFTADVFVGVCGSGKEQGLDAARRALSDPLASGANAGFLRPGARLAVIIVSDDDDCSDPLRQGTNAEPTACTSYPVQNYVDFFQGPIGGERRDVVVGVIGAVDPATLEPSQCTEPGGGLAEHGAARYKAFADAFGSAAVLDSVCNPSFRDTLVKIAGLIDPGQVLPLQGAPPDWRMLAVSVVRANGEHVACRVGDGSTGAAEALYLPPSGDQPARLQFSGACTLQQGDRVDVKLLCAR